MTRRHILSIFSNCTVEKVVLVQNRVVWIQYTNREGALKSCWFLTMGQRIRLSRGLCFVNPY